MIATAAQLVRAQAQVDTDAKHSPHLAGKIVALKPPKVFQSIIVVYEDGRETEYIGKAAVIIQAGDGTMVPMLSPDGVLTLHGAKGAVLFDED